VNRYCPECAAVLTIESNPVFGYCQKCNWSGGLDDFSPEFKLGKTTTAPWTPYISIDLETTGLNEEYCQILEFGAIIDDWRTPIEELPHFRKYIRPHDEINGQPYIYGEPYALALNHEIIHKLAANDPTESCTEEELGEVFATWLKEHGIDPLHTSASGKNFTGFDLQFLKQVHGFSEHVRFNHRAIDPAILWWNPAIDTELPSTKECLFRADLDGRVAHTTIEDCTSVIQLVRRGVWKCKLSVSD